MEFRILGPLEASAGGRELSLGGPKPRALLALLLLHSNEVVPADRLIDELWGEDSPDDAAAALRVNVARLRKALPQDVIATTTARLRPPGRAGRARSPSLRAPGRRWTELARPRPRSGRVRAATRRALAVAGPAAGGLRLRELRPGGNRPARGDQADSGGAPDRRRPRARAPRRAGRRARGTGRRAPAPRAPADVSDDGAVPVGPAGGGPGRLPGRAPVARRRAWDRTEYCTPGAGAGDPPAGPRAGCRSAGARRPSGGRGAVESSSRSWTRPASRRCSPWPSGSCETPLMS